MLSKRHSKQGFGSYGFTVLELLVSTLVFSVVLLVITAGIIAFTRQYYHGVINSRTQATTRAIMAELTQSLQFGRTVNLGLVNGSANGFCIDNKLFSYVTGQQVESSPDTTQHQNYQGFVENNNGGTCSATSGSSLSVPATAVLPSGERELLGDHMRLGDLTIQPTAGGLYRVHLRVIYGTDDLLSSTNWATAVCKGGSGSQFCSVSELTTTVQQRLE